MHAHAELPKENTLFHGKIGDREQLSVQPFDSRERFVFIRITIRNPQVRLLFTSQRLAINY